MKIKGRLIAIVAVFAAIGLGAYIWFVTVPSLTCTDESRESEHAYEEYFIAQSARQNTLKKIRAPIETTLSADEMTSRINNDIDESNRAFNLEKLALNKYLTAVEEHLDCVPIF